MREHSALSNKDVTMKEVGRKKISPIWEGEWGLNSSVRLIVIQFRIGQTPKVPDLRSVIVN